MNLWALLKIYFFYKLVFMFLILRLNTYIYVPKSTIFNFLTTEWMNFKPYKFI